jgi:hypothetical protein
VPIYLVKRGTPWVLIFENGVFVKFTDRTQGTGGRNQRQQQRADGQRAEKMRMSS